MSRVDDAMRRAAAAAGAQTERIADGVDRSVLHRYPAEERSLRPAPDAGGPVVRRTADSADVVVRPRFSQAYAGKLVVDAGVPPQSIEQFRRLAATVHHIQAEQGMRHLMVSSASPREGKTLTIVNLALTLSESYGRRVLLIDADLRRPSVHDVFGISNKYGVAHAIQSEPMEIRTSRVCQNLWVLPAGTPDGNPMAALASGQMERLLGDATASFDWVLVDAPPFGLVADAALLARLVRAVIVVIAAGSTQYKAVEKAVTELGREYVVGAVLNRVEEDGAPGWSEYYTTNNDVIGASSNDPLPDNLVHVRRQKVGLTRS